MIRYALNNGLITQAEYDEWARTDPLFYYVGD